MSFNLKYWPTSINPDYIYTRALREINTWKTRVSVTSILSYFFYQILSTAVTESCYSFNRPFFLDFWQMPHSWTAKIIHLYPTLKDLPPFHVVTGKAKRVGSLSAPQILSQTASPWGRQVWSSQVLLPLCSLEEQLRGGRGDRGEEGGDSSRNPDIYDQSDGMSYTPLSLNKNRPADF